jgi:N-acetylglucosamine kinase-like BadF-type ATPase
MARSYADVARSAMTIVEPEHVMQQVPKRVVKRVVKKTLFEYITSTYPRPEDDKLVQYIYANKNRLRTWKDFAEVVAEQVETEEGESINVFKSSSWAVCQEFLGKIRDREELNYTRSRGGIWSIASQIVDIDCKMKVIVDIITVRDILTDLKQAYP